LVETLPRWAIRGYWKAAGRNGDGWGGKCECAGGSLTTDFTDFTDEDSYELSDQVTDNREILANMIDFFSLVVRRTRIETELDTRLPSVSGQQRRSAGLHP
jgi:hypothetical protein